MNVKGLPEGWEWAELDDITFEYISGGTPSTKHIEYWSGSIPWTRSANITSKYLQFGEKFISSEAVADTAANVVPKGNVLVATRVSVGKSAVNLIDVAISQDLTGLILDLDRILPSYLVYYLHSPQIQQRLEQYSRGTTIKGIQRSDLSSIKIPLPPLDTQRKIVAILEKAEATQRLRAEADALMQKLMQSVFLEMFGDPMTNPMGWKVCKLSELIESRPNNGIFVKNDSYGAGNARVIWISDFINNMYVNTDCLKQIYASDEELKKYKVQYGDVLFCRSSLNYEGVGKVSCVPKSIPDHTLFECHIIKLSLNTERLLPEFFQIQSVLPYFRHQIFKHAKTATMTTISQSGVTDCWVIVPPIQLQKKFVNIVSNFTDLKLYQKISSSQNSELFDSLRLKAFNGDLTV